MKILRTKWSNFVASVRRFDQDEDGIEAIQVVMILAFGAVVMVAAWAMWDQIKAWAQGLIQAILGKK